MVHPNDITLGGWDISAMNLGTERKENEKNDRERQREEDEERDGWMVGADNTQRHKRGTLVE